VKNKKSLGQHWLKNREVLLRIAEFATDGDDEVVLEVGPGLGTLTSALFRCFGRVIAVEFDEELAEKLPGQFPGKNLEVVNSDIIGFDLRDVPRGYKVVANVPYYITSKIVRKFLTEENKPRVMVLLVQKEVAERLAAKAGDLSILGVSAQVYAKVSLGEVVGREKFTPAPKVDSQVVKLEVYERSLVEDVGEEEFFRLVKMGFSSPRKKLVKNLMAGMWKEREEVEELLAKSGVDGDLRAEALSIEDWKRILVNIQKN